jgi:hypothetical protein
VLYQRNEAGGGVVTKVVCEGFEHRTVTRAHHTRQRLGPNRFEAFVVYIVSCVRTILVETFLPKGYPESVAPEYLRFQVDVEGFSHTRWGILTFLTFCLRFLDLGFHSSHV